MDHGTLANFLSTVCTSLANHNPGFLASIHKKLQIDYLLHVDHRRSGYQCELDLEFHSPNVELDC
jgi:hypothetical protein